MTAEDPVLLLVRRPRVVFPIPSGGQLVVDGLAPNEIRRVVLDRVEVLIHYVPDGFTANVIEGEGSSTMPGASE